MPDKVTKYYMFECEVKVTYDAGGFTFTFSIPRFGKVSQNVSDEPSRLGANPIRKQVFLAWARLFDDTQEAKRPDDSGAWAGYYPEGEGIDIEHSLRQPTFD